MASMVSIDRLKIWILNLKRIMTCCLLYNTQSDNNFDVYINTAVILTTKNLCIKLNGPSVVPQNNAVDVDYTYDDTSDANFNVLATKIIPDDWTTTLSYRNIYVKNFTKIVLA